MSWRPCHHARWWCVHCPTNVRLCESIVTTTDGVCWHHYHHCLLYCCWCCAGITILRQWSVTLYGCSTPSSAPPRRAPSPYHDTHIYFPKHSSASIAPGLPATNSDATQHGSHNSHYENGQIKSSPDMHISGIEHPSIGSHSDVDKGTVVSSHLAGVSHGNYNSVTAEGNPNKVHYWRHTHNPSLPQPHYHDSLPGSSHATGIYATAHTIHNLPLLLFPLCMPPPDCFPLCFSRFGSCSVSSRCGLYWKLKSIFVFFVFHLNINFFAFFTFLFSKY